MSEYQYYEFQAIDRPLSVEEMNELRSYSTRAQITPTSFVNEYQWGHFKGDPHTWMENYFDAFLYFANWGTRVLKLRVPCRLLDPTTASDYCCGESAFAKENAGKVIVSFVSEDETAEDCEDECHLSSMISVRAELARGDLRALYLGWLLCAQNGELDPEDVEPPVPAGLGDLSASLESMASFLCIDSDLIQIAAQSSPALKDTRPKREDVRDWITRISAKEKEELILNLVLDGDHTCAAELLKRFHNEQSPGSIEGSPARRNVGEMLRAAELVAEGRERAEIEKCAKDKARREREALIAREKHLDSLASHEATLWANIETLVAATQPKSYEQAIKLLIDLRDLDARAWGGDFENRIQELRQSHARKSAFIERLRKAGL